MVIILNRLGRNGLAMLHGPFIIVSLNHRKLSQRGQFLTFNLAQTIKNKLMGILSLYYTNFGYAAKSINTMIFQTNHLLTSLTVGLNKDEKNVTTHHEYTPLFCISRSG